ncbi:hypothetical protein PR048_009316 [Dryococelus australis]|uniref:Uncharacterized protein n=1 Tax=Dryococelus australis TaxID=614101 RepID=A0ABQ9HZI9_9NEOP|nr:hypothetical protein PR048_009316 [Dryococelus australis]
MIGMEDTGDMRDFGMVGLLTDAAKKLHQTHMTGGNCRCKKLRCFENVCEAERSRIIKYFNALQSYDEQNVHFAGLITVCEVTTRNIVKPIFTQHHINTPLE